VRLHRRAVAAGDALIAPAVTRRLIEEFARRPEPASAPAPGHRHRQDLRDAAAHQARRQGPGPARHHRLRRGPGRPGPV